jgi:hypothetical protein
MGAVDQSMLDLIEWQQRQSQHQLTTKSPRIKTEVSDVDIINSTRRSLLGDPTDDPSPNNSEDEGNSDDESADGKSDSSEDNEDTEVIRVTRKAPVEPRGRQESHRTSPKRRRTEDVDQTLAPYQAPAPMYPPFNPPPYHPYPGNNGPLPGHQLVGTGSNIDAYSLQHQQNPGTGPIAGGYTHQNQPNMLGASDSFGNFDLSLTQAFSSPGYQAEAMQDTIPVRTRRLPQVPQGRKAKTSKSTSRGRTSGRRKTIH